MLPQSSMYFFIYFILFCFIYLFFIVWDSIYLIYIVSVYLATIIGTCYLFGLIFLVKLPMYVFTNSDAIWKKKIKRD